MLVFAQLPQPLPPPPPEIRTLGRERGDQVRIDGQGIRSPWAWIPPRDGQPPQLWLPLELLENRLGFSRTQGTLRWFGTEHPLAQLPQRRLGDEVALDAWPWLQQLGVTPDRNGPRLELTLQAPTLQQLRRGTGQRSDRLVLDLDGPVFVQRVGRDLVLELRADQDQIRMLQGMGIGASHQGSTLRLRGQATRLRSLSLANPWRLVLDGVRPNQGSTAQAPRPVLPLTHPQIAPLIRKGFVLEHRQIKVGVKPLELWRVGGQLQSLGLTLQAQTQVGTQQGLRFLPQLSSAPTTVAAVNGGFFNRITQLPLGALRKEGTWLSGPILNRGAVGWNRGGIPRFGRLSLTQELRGPDRRTWRLSHLNSGYIQRGLSRYTDAWGPRYKALSGEEAAVLISNGRVEQAFDQDALAHGVVLPAGKELIVARGGIEMPIKPGDQVQLQERVNAPLGDLANVIGGGPLLLMGGQVVLNGRIEGFSPDFLRVRAPRTVVGHGPDGTWLIALRGSTGTDPTLLETALAAQQLKLKQALNLDGGSSTTLVVAGRTVVNGRGFPPLIHNGLGLGLL